MSILFVSMAFSLSLVKLDSGFQNVPELVATAA
jgi:hypothetical protein